MPDAGPRLLGALVELRPVVEADAARLRAIHAAPEVAAWWGAMDDGFPFDDDGSAARLAIVAAGEVVGMIQFGEMEEPEYRHAWIDVFLDPARRGRGYAPDAIRTLLGHLFGARGHHRVTIDPATDNEAAIRAYEKAGFRRVGVMEAAWRDDHTGEWRDTLFMELVRGRERA